MNVKRAIPRAIYYAYVGYAKYLNFPISMLAFISLIFDALLKLMPEMAWLFPSFAVFLAFSLTFVPAVAAFFGYMHYKRKLRFLYTAEMDILSEANPYTSEIVVPVQLPTLKLLSALGKQHGLDTSDVDRIIQRTERFYRQNSA